MSQISQGLEARTLTEAGDLTDTGKHLLTVQLFCILPVAHSSADNVLDQVNKGILDTSFVPGQCTLRSHRSGREVRNTVEKPARSVWRDLRCILLNPSS